MKHRIREIIVVVVFLFPGSTWASQLVVIESTSPTYNTGNFVETTSMIQLAEGCSLFDSTSDSHGTEYGAAFEAMKAGSPRAAELFGALREKYPTDPLIAFHSTRLSQGETGSRIVMKEK